MREGRRLMLLLLLLVAGWEEQFCSGQIHLEEEQHLEYSREDFPPDFIFGAGTSAFQVEGAAEEDGRTPSIWDTFAHSAGAWVLLRNATADVTSDGYHKYKEDAKLMSDVGLDSYRFSISWSRLLPNGRGPVNPKGLEYYNNLLNELVRYGIKAHVTLYHLDLPQVLEDEYGGWVNEKIVDDFTAYADVCFREFGDRVSQWTTVVEPNVIAMAAYDQGVFPPNRCSNPFGLFNCTAGDSTTEPYLVLHNFLLAHASAVRLYKTRYQGQQKGLIGLNIYTYWTYPFSNSTLDIQAAQRTRDFLIGWVMNPLVFGDYPKIMKKIARERLPSFTNDQFEQVKGSFDFVGVNHYTSIFVKDNSNVSMAEPRDFTGDLFAIFAFSQNATPSGGVINRGNSISNSFQASFINIFIRSFVPCLVCVRVLFDQLIPFDMPVDPDGLRHILEHIKNAYGNPLVFVEENGYGLWTNDTINDVERINYLSSYIGSMLTAIRNGCNVKGYFVWSFLDVFEFLAGYQTRYGLYYVDFKDPNRRRQPKLSALWYSQLLRSKSGAKLSRKGLLPENFHHPRQ